MIQLILLPDGVMIFVCPDEKARTAIIDAYRPVMMPGHELPNSVLVVVGPPLSVLDYRLLVNNDGEVLS